MNSRAWMIGIMVILGVVCSAALALVTRVTAPVIEANEHLRDVHLAAGRPRDRGTQSVQRDRIEADLHGWTDTAWVGLEERQSKKYKTWLI